MSSSGSEHLALSEPPASPDGTVVPTAAAAAAAAAAPARPTRPGLFASGMPNNTNTREAKAFFGRWGKVSSFKLLPVQADRSGFSGSCLLRYSTACSALDALDNANVPLRSADVRHPIKIRMQSGYTREELERLATEERTARTYLAPSPVTSELLARAALAAKVQTAEATQQQHQHQHQQAQSSPTSSPYQSQSNLYVPSVSQPSPLASSAHVATPHQHHYFDPSFVPQQQTFQAHPTVVQQHPYYHPHPSASPPAPSAPSTHYDFVDVFQPSHHHVPPPAAAGFGTDPNTNYTVLPMPDPSVAAGPYGYGGVFGEPPYNMLPMHLPAPVAPYPAPAAYPAAAPAPAPHHAHYQLPAYHQCHHHHEATSLSPFIHAHHLLYPQAPWHFAHQQQQPPPPPHHNPQQLHHHHQHQHHPLSTQYPPASH